MTETLSPKGVAELREFVVYIRDQNDLYIKHSGTTGKYLTPDERQRVDRLLDFASQSLEREGEIRKLAIEECAEIVRRHLHSPDAIVDAFLDLAQQPPAKEGM